MPKKNLPYIIIIISIFLILSGCGSEQDIVVNTDPIDTEETKQATEIPASPTPTPSATPSNTPTPTESPPTATPIVVLPPEPIEIMFEASDGQELSGLYFPAEENPAPIIVLMTWSRGNQSEWEEVAYWLQGRELLIREINVTKTWKNSRWWPERTLDIPLGVFTFNFRSCPGENGCEAYLPAEWLLDAQAALEMASKLEGIDSSRILTAGASIGADGAVNSCAWLNTTDLGTCLGAFTLSPSSFLTIDFSATTDALLTQENPAIVYCLYGLRDAAARETCGSYPDIRAVDYGLIYDHGLELILLDRRPNPLNLLQEFILEALGGAQ